MPRQEAQAARMLDDPRVIEQVEAYREALLQGQNPDRQQLLDQFPDIADELAACLNALQFVRGLAPRVNQQVAESLGEVSDHQHSPLAQALGDYRIVREVGRGGMGVVYEAEQVSLGRKVALKVLPFAAMMDKRQLQRFHNEARAAASLRHPCIVQVHHVGCERAVHFYAMDYIEGQTLAELISNLRRLERLEGGAPEDGGKGVSDLADSLASGRFAPPKGSSDPNAPTAAYAHERTPDRVAGVERSEPPAAETARTPQAAISTERSTKSPAYFRSIAEIGVQVAEALDHAHQNGVVHRDVKPSNVILDNSGKPWVTDFGLARIETDATLTVSGDLLGTVRYMSPEQALAKRIVVDHRTDVYSLGVTLYELLTLQPVFSGQDRQELLRQIAFDEPKAPRRLNKAVPEELEIIVLKAMAKNPAERYETAQELADDLRRFLEDRPIRARRPTLVQRAAKWSRRHKPIVWSAGVLLILATLGSTVSSVVVLGAKRETEEALVLLEEQKTEAQENANRAVAAKTVADRARKLAERQKRLAEKQQQLAEEAQKEAERQRQIAENAAENALRQRERAESNLDLALEALDNMYVEAIGRERMLGDRDTFFLGFRQLSNSEKKLMQAGLNCYSQISKQDSGDARSTLRAAMALNRSGRLHNTLGDSQFAEMSYREAIKILVKLAESHPDNAAYFRELGEAYLGLGRSLSFSEAKSFLQEAIGALDRANELRPNDADVYHLHSLVYYHLTQNGQAVADAAKAVELDPNTAWRHYHLAVLLHFNFDARTSDDYRSLEHAKRAVELAPEDGIFRAMLGRCYWDILRDRERALEELDTAIQLSPHTSVAYIHRARVFLDSGHLQNALENVQKALQVSPSEVAFKYRAIVYSRLGRLDEALRDANEAQRLGPDGPDTYYNRALIRVQMKRYEEALADFSKAIELAPNYAPPRIHRARAYLELAQYAKVLPDIEKASELDPNARTPWRYIDPSSVKERQDPEAYYLLAIARTHLDRHEEAQRFWERGEELLAQQQGQPEDESLSQLQEQARSMIAVGREVMTYVYRSMTLSSEGKYDEAVQNANTGLSVAPDDLGLLRERALAYGGLEAYEEALADCKRYLELEPGDARAALIRAQMLLLADRTEAYREACKEMLRWFAERERPGCTAARACVLAPKGAPDPTVPVQLAERAVSRDPREWTFHTLGMAQLRAGQLQEAEQRFQESLKTDPNWIARYLNWLGLALVHHARGEMKESREWLDKAVELMEEDPGPAPEDRLEGQILRREVEQLLGEPEQEKQDAESKKEE